MSILFYSKECAHSMNLIKDMNNMDLSIEVQLVDINEIDTIPSFLDRVPTLFLKEESKILHDEELFDYISKHEKNVEPFMIKEMKGLSDSYSFMEDEIQLDHGYVFLDRGEPQITTNKSLDKGNNNKIVEYDQFLENRDKDIRDIIKTQHPGA